MNSLFVAFLQQLEHEAKQRHFDHLAQNYHKALRELKKFPRPLWTGTEAMAVPRIGPFIAKKLDDMLTQFETSSAFQGAVEVGDLQRSEPSLKKPHPKQSKRREQSRQSDNQNKRIPQIKATETRIRGEKTYVPKPRSGPWALLVALHRASSLLPHCNGFLTKAELIHFAQPLCDSSFFSQSGTYYSAWNSMSTLLKKGLVMKSGRPVRYSLTDAGKSLAKTLDDTNPPLGDDNKLCTSPRLTSFACLSSHDEHQQFQSATTVHSLANYIDFLLSQRLYSCQNLAEHKSNDTVLNDDTALRTHRILQVRLVIDNRERTNSQTPSCIANQLTAVGCPCEVRKLELGDIIWIGVTDTGDELVLPYVVERKIIADLCASIIDGRYKEQKFRLSQCGLQHVIYLLEGDVTTFFCNNYSKGVTREALETALTKTQLYDNFFLKQTKTTQDTIQYLCILTRTFHEQYTAQCNQYCSTSNEELLQRKQRFSLCLRDREGREVLFTFSQYNELNAKNNLTLTDIFAKQIMVLRGGSVDKAVTITKEYPTPFLLIQKYNSLSTEEEKLNLFKNTICIRSGRRLGPAFSKVMYRTFCGNAPRE